MGRGTVLYKYMREFGRSFDDVAVRGSSGGADSSASQGERYVVQYLEYMYVVSTLETGHSVLRSLRDVKAVSLLQQCGGEVHGCDERVRQY